MQTISKHKKENRSLLYEITVMAIIHYFFFILYAICTTHIPDIGGMKMSREYAPVSVESKSMIGISGSSSRKSSSANSNQSSKHAKYEPGYPKISRTHYFPTRATEKEMAKHDRYIVHGILYTETLKHEYIAKNWRVPQVEELNNPPLYLQRKVCVNILMKNRSVPYINALMMTLMMSHEADERDKNLNTWFGKGYRLLSYAQLNIIDTERRLEFLNYDRLRKKIMNLPFVKYHQPFRASVITSNYDPKNRRLNKMEEYIAAANQCMKSNLRWCIIMEEYTVVPIDFLKALQQFVIAPLESHILVHGTPEKYPDDEALMEKMSVLSLFSTTNSKSGTRIQIHNLDYSRDLYDTDRGKLNSERRGLGLHRHKSMYEMYPDNGTDDDGDDEAYNTAMLFSTAAVKTKLIPMLQDLRDKEIWYITNGYSDDSRENMFNLEAEFRLYTGVKRYHLEPSLVNRIGFYDEEFDDIEFGDERLGISNWITDTRFLFEAGYFWEGKDEYCMQPNGEWIEDAYYNDDTKSSCEQNEENEGE
mmetsp:Transcript_22142/g.25194  ORF Transcript_22142/g.25194 Transcript_22142/m.25194 type:complete len:532 (-) Transcript_22142:41-1636(-)